MNKKQLIDRVAEVFTEQTGEEVTKVTVKQVFDATLEAIIETVEGGDSVNITGFGKFEPRHRNARVGFNPKTQEKIDIPATRAVGFKVGKLFKDRVKEA